MNPVQQKLNAKNFVERWKAEPGNEDQQSRSFWIEFAQELLGIPQATHVLDFERKVKGRKVDVFYEDMGVLVEQKSRGVSLDEASVRSKKAGAETPYQQAKWYADNMPHSIRPRWLVVCNFDEFRIHDLDTEDPATEYISVALDELPQMLHLFGFFTDERNSRLVREKELSVQAGEIVGRLYESLSSQYQDIDNDHREQHSLNVLIVRLVFLLYAEDAGLLQKKNAFLDYLKAYRAADTRTALIDLFRMLNTPEDERDRYANPELLAFPYVNGGLFEADDIVIPQFTDQIRFDLLKEASQDFDWSDISPTIFGAAFESTLNPETRRSGGMHYTSIENIHKVIDPLFLDDLKAELAEIEGESVEVKRKAKLRRFQKKISELKFLDPAAGSHNFLTETYLSLRKLELRVIEGLHGDQTSFDLLDDPVMVNIGQFYAIEINDFAVSVGKTALWIAEEQMLEKTQELLPYQDFDFLPLKSITNSVCANALRIDWNDVLPAEECDYIIGNPPFYGSSNCDARQKKEIADLFGKVKLANSLDYVSGWYYKACEMMASNKCVRSAFVSTNSITQGEQVYPIWNTLTERFGVTIDFAWRTFVWDSEASSKAHVHCVIIGFSCDSTEEKVIYDENGDAKSVKSVSPYLIDAPSILPASRKRPICDVPALAYGNKPTDDGAFVLTPEEKEALVAAEPEVVRFLRPYIGAKEFLNGKERWCLWLLGAAPEEIASLPHVSKRVDHVRAFRLASSAKDTRKRSDSPHEFFRTPVHDVPYMAVPRTSSERRPYLPIGFFGAGTIPSDAASVIPNATLYQFGVLESQFHNAWMRVVAGRLKSDYRYSGDVVYNNFVWPSPTGAQKARIEECAQAVLDARDLFPEKSLAELYDPDKMPDALRDAHKALDAAVEAAYGVDFGGDEEKIVAHLFKLHAEMTAEG